MIFTSILYNGCVCLEPKQIRQLLTDGPSPILGQCGHALGQYRTHHGHALGHQAIPITRFNFTTEPSQLLVTSRVVAVVALLSVGHNDHGGVAPNRARRYSLSLIA